MVSRSTISDAYPFAHELPDRKSLCKDGKHDHASGERDQGVAFRACGQRQRVRHLNPAAQPSPRQYLRGSPRQIENARQHRPGGNPTVSSRDSSVTATARHTVASSWRVNTTSSASMQIRTKSVALSISSIKFQNVST